MFAGEGGIASILYRDAAKLRLYSRGLAAG